MKNKWILGACLVACSFSAWAQPLVKDSWVRETPAAQPSTGVFMNIESEKAARLVDARSDAAKVVEIHTMEMEGDVMKMRRIEGLDVEPGKTLALTPGGYHIMLIDLVKPLEAGNKVALTLVFEQDGKREEVKTEAEVRKMVAGEGGHDHHDHGHHDHGDKKEHKH